MKITQDNQGWRIEPSTSDEEAHLKYLLDALQKAYAGISVETLSKTLDSDDHDKSN